MTSADFWTYGSAFIVWAGVVGESVAELTEWIKPESRRKKVAKISSIVLILGLAGDVIGIRKTQVEIGILTKQAGDAKKSADAAADAARRANSFAEQAEQHARQADEKADRFRLQIAQANERAARADATAKLFESEIAKSNATAKTAESQVASANARAQEAEAKAEGERLERLKLEARLADRTLTPQQQNTLVSQLSDFHGTEIDVVASGDTPEIQNISGLVVNSLLRAGWTVNSAQGVGGGSGYRGILIGTRTGSDLKTVRASATLISALQAAGLAAWPMPFEQLGQGASMSTGGFRGTGQVRMLAPIRMVIGSKP